MVSNCTRPAKASATGPSRTAILPRKFCASTTSVSAAPGMQGAMRRMSISTAQACAGDNGTSNELSNSILLVFAGLDPAINGDVEQTEALHGCAGQARA